MYLYVHGEKETIGNHTIFVQPANEFPLETKWVSEKGEKIIVPVNFKNGKTDQDIDEGLAQFLVDKKYAFKNPAPRRMSI